MERKKMKGKACADGFQVQDFAKKKKKKKRKHEYNNEHENDEIMENPELRCASPLLFDNAAAKGGEAKKKKKKLKKEDKEQQALIDNYCVSLEREVSNGTGGAASPLLSEDAAAKSGEGKKKKKKLKQKGEKQQVLIDNYCVNLEHEVSNGTGGAAAPKKKRKQKGNDSTDEHSDVACVPVNQHITQDCQETDADYVYFKKPKKKKKRKRLEADEVRELSPSEKHGKGNKEKSKKKQKKRREGSAQDVQEDTEGAAEQALLSSSEQSRRHRGCPSPADEDGDCDAASTISEVSMEIPADFSTPNNAAGRAKKTPAYAKKANKSSAFVMEESPSESDVMTPNPLESNKKKQQNQQNSSFAELAASDELSLDGEESTYTLCLYPAMTSIIDLDTARQELEEFIPHVRNISDSSIKKMAGRDLMRFKEFKKQGMAVKFGRFTHKENIQIQKNVEEFLALTGIDSAEKLLFTSRYPEDKDTIHRLKTQHHFCEKISEGIPRPWRLIYYRARKMFDPNNYKGRYTVEEKEQLKKYQALHGNDWKKISELMSRSNLSVAMKFSEIKSAINYGPWTKEETQRLMNAIKEVMKRKLKAENTSSLSSLDQSSMDLWIDREKLYQQLPWTEIETKVGSRYWRQCKQKWNSILTSKMSRGQQLYRGTNGLQAKINLIKRLYETKAEDTSEVNWDELSNAIGDVPGAYVQTKFYRLKVSCVPLWRRKTFPEVIEYLYEKKLPELEEKLKKQEGKYRSFGNSTASQQQKAFRLSDIFDSSEDSD